MSAATAPPRNPNGSQATPPAAQRGDDVVQFVPFMEKDPIKLSVAIVKNFVCTPTKSGKVCDDRQAMQFVMLCRARQLNPFAGDAFLVGYDSQHGPTFSLITAHLAFLKRAETHPEYDGMRSGVMVRDASGAIVDREGDFAFDDDLILGGWAYVYFKSRKYPMFKRTKMSTYNKGFGRWKEDAAGMIVKVAEADALRSSFPTLLGGMYLEEELSPKQVEAVVRNAPSIALPPTGRQSLRGKPSLAAPPVEMPTAAPVVEAASEPDPREFQHPDDRAELPTDPPPTDDATEQDRVAQEIADAIAQAKTQHELQANDGPGDLMERNKEWLGAERHGRLVAAYREKWGALEKGRAGKKS